MLNEQLNQDRRTMYVDLILTFSTLNDEDDSQEFYNLYLPIGNKEIDAIRFIDESLFPIVLDVCDETNRDVKDLIKISTASDWALFESKTNLPSLPKLGHNCKWYFGLFRDDLDYWEKSLMQRFSFGLNAT